ncbi:capsule biosynthesis protein [Aquirhabdus sp.]|uniref:capsule biosynthesis protein n=1 Tax=Aquirhabdus sp. TaxID=2824160 RepID=UPI00396C5A6C
MQATHSQSVDHNTTQSLLARLVAWVRGNTLLAVVVILPTLVSIVYYGLIASDVYISTSEYVVRSPQKQQSSSGIGALLQGAGFSKAADDVYAVHDYMLSRDAMFTLDRSLGLKKIYGNKDIDIFNRYAALSSEKSSESLYKYYSKKVTIDLDTVSSISTLEVRAYTAEDAWRINEQLIELSETLVNKMNERGRIDAIRSAQQEVDAARQSAVSAAKALSVYRNNQGIFDTDKQSALQLEQVAKLQDQLVTTITQLNQVKSLAPKNPQIPVLENQKATLLNEIAKQTSGVSGGQRSLSTKSPEYDQLQFNYDVAGKQLAASLATLELAKNDSQRKQLYVERIVQPNKPDKAMEPRRIRNVFATFALGSIVWFVLSMLIAGVREHQN